MIRLQSLSWQTVAILTGTIMLTALAVLIAIGLQEPLKWSTDVWAGGKYNHSSRIVMPPFPALSRLDVFDINVREGGSHLYILGSDEGGRDLLALVARGAIPSFELVAIVVVARFCVGAVVGLAIGARLPLARELGRWIGSVALGFPYIAFAAITIQAIVSQDKTIAFVIGMTIVGWRDISELVAERIEYVRSKPFSEAAAALGTHGLRFFRLHVIPFLRPALGVELPFQVSAVLALLAELGYIQVFLGPPLELEVTGGPPTVLIDHPELGQLLSLTRPDILAGQFAVALVPALAIALIAFSFELIGTGVRGRTRLSS